MGRSEAIRRHREAMRALNGALGGLGDAHMALQESDGAFRTLERGEIDKKGLQHDWDVVAIAFEYGEEPTFKFESRHKDSNDETPTLIAGGDARIAASTRRRQALAALDAARSPARLQ
jgi:hypothetical protein